MGIGNEHDPPSEWAGKRWYDQDPALSRAMEHLRNASDRYQAQIALNIIKIIIEHHIEENSSLDVDELTHELQNGKGKSILGIPHLVDHAERRRWYDVNETLRSAIQLLRDTPDDLQKKIIPTIARMIEQTLEEPFKAY